MYKSISSVLSIIIIIIIIIAEYSCVLNTTGFYGLKWRMLSQFHATSIHREHSLEGIACHHDTWGRVVSLQTAHYAWPYFIYLNLAYHLLEALNTNMIFTSWLKMNNNNYVKVFRESPNLVGSSNIIDDLSANEKSVFHIKTFYSKAKNV